MDVALTGDGRRADLINRLYDAFSENLSDVEEGRAVEKSAEVIETAKILNNLARTLQTLLRLEDDEHTSDAPDIARLRQELADRLAQFVGMRAGDEKTNDAQTL